MLILLKYADQTSCEKYCYVIQEKNFIQISCLITSTALQGSSSKKPQHIKLYFLFQRVQHRPRNIFDKTLFNSHKGQSKILHLVLGLLVIPHFKTALGSRWNSIKRMQFSQTLADRPKAFITNLMTSEQFTVISRLRVPEHFTISYLITTWIFTSISNSTKPKLAHHLLTKLPTSSASIIDSNLIIYSVS